ncbi:YxiG-like protein [Luteimonas sp. A649]
MDHGFVPHGRDYFVLVESSMGNYPGRHQVQFTHVAEVSYTSVVADDVWTKSWGEEFVDYQAWLDAEEPEGYVWGTCWSLAWPGIRAVEPSTKAAEWSARLGKPMYEAEIETDRFRISLVFHSLRSAKVSDESSIVSSVVIPLS